MQKQITTWKFLLSSLERNIPVMLLYVLESKGSSPGRQGFFMGVNSAGEMCGSIGGGIMEFKFVEMVKARLAEHTQQSTVFKQVHDKAAAKDQSGMICSGEQTIFLYKLNFEDREGLKEIIDTLDSNNNCYLQLSEDGINVGATSLETGLHQTPQTWTYSEVLGYTDHLYIIGGGHCSLALSKLMHTLGFYIHVFEERKSLNTFDANDSAHEKIIIESYSQLENIVPSGENNFVVVMTFGYRTDDIALRALRNKKFRYIGCLGSKNKMGKMMDAYKTEGLDDEWLRYVHAPIGIQIKSQTPEEIAVSIAAEIIKVRNEKK